MVGKSYRYVGTPPYIGDVRCDTERVFDYTSYFVAVGLSNTVQLRSLENHPDMLELLESLLCCPVVRNVFFFLSRCNKDVSFNLRVSSLAESGICKDASVFEQRSAVNSELACEVITGHWFCHRRQK